MPQINNINIPAYQRKRSLARRAAKQNVPFYKRKKTSKPRKTTRTRISRRKYPQYEEQFPRIPISGLPSEELFPEPMLEDEFIKSRTPEVREMIICGQCEGYFDKIEVTVIKVTSPIRKGDILIFEKQGGLFEQPVESMQINRKDVTLARSGSDIGIKVAMKPQVGTPVYKVI